MNFWQGFWIGFIVAMFIGTALGYVICGLLTAGKQYDKKMGFED